MPLSPLFCGLGTLQIRVGRHEVRLGAPRFTSWMHASIYRASRAAPPQAAGLPSDGSSSRRSSRGLRAADEWNTQASWRQRLGEAKKSTTRPGISVGPWVGVSCQTLSCGAAATGGLHFLRVVSGLSLNNKAEEPRGRRLGLQGIQGRRVHGLWCSDDRREQTASHSVPAAVNCQLFFLPIPSQCLRAH